MRETETLLRDCRAVMAEYVALADAANTVPVSALLTAVPLERVAENLRRARLLLAQLESAL
jgi:hypothetical protein